MTMLFAQKFEIRSGDASARRWVNRFAFVPPKGFVAVCPHVGDKGHRKMRYYEAQTGCTCHNIIDGLDEGREAVTRFLGEFAAVQSVEHESGPPAPLSRKTRKGRSLADLGGLAVEGKLTGVATEALRRAFGFEFRIEKKT